MFDLDFYSTTPAPTTTEGFYQDEEWHDEDLDLFDDEDLALLMVEDFDDDF